MAGMWHKERESSMQFCVEGPDTPAHDHNSDEQTLVVPQSRGLPAGFVASKHIIGLEAWSSTNNIFVHIHKGAARCCTRRHQGSCFSLIAPRPRLVYLRYNSNNME